MTPPVLALLLLLCLSSPIVHGGCRDQISTTASSLKSKTVCSGHRVNVLMPGRAWLPLNHRHGPCSPLPSSETVPTTADMLRRDQLRADGIRRGFNSRKQHRRVTVPLKLGSSLDTMQYVVTVGLGTPAVNQTVHIDTGSDIFWVQCRPCPIPPCHHQKDAMFDPARSATYSAVPCGSAACLGLGSGSNSYAHGCSGSLCQFTVGYADSSNTTGTYSSDKLTLTPTYSINGLRFGCSHDAEMYDDEDKADGIMGLGGGVQSLVSQTKEKAFSYCLPPSESYSGFLTLGVPRVASSRFVVTPLYKVDGTDTPYVVRLEGIVVAGRRLKVPTSVFSGAAVIDSGTIITRLPTAAYRALRAAFREEMKMYPRADPTEPFDTCYDLDGVAGEVKLPSVALVFERGATVELDRSGIILDGCLAFKSVDDPPTIIGNVQQRTFEVLYNVGGRSVGFRRGAC